MPVNPCSGVGFATRPFYLFLKHHRNLGKFGGAALRFAYAWGIRVAVLFPGETYAQRSPALRRLNVDVDGWPAPPSGLFVVEERRVYLRSSSPMTVAHEFGHGLDCALGGGVYLSGSDERLRGLFAKARSFVTPYAATGADEYFAEGLRAFVGANDVRSFWPAATRKRLRLVDPALFLYIDELFVRLRSGSDLRGGNGAGFIAPRRTDERYHSRDVVVTELALP